ncbi:MAG: hypothetical protein O3C10_02520 [Chloroflexi bacterium]|nr:hypothetical protein [Chloroflexota bacterium]
MAAAAVLVSLTAVACGSSGGDATAQPSPTAITPGGPADERPTLVGTEDFTQRNEENGLTTILATTDLGVGTDRFAFVLTQPTGLVKFPVVSASTYFYPSGYAGDREGPIEEQLTVFREFPFGTRGVYSADYTFDRPGEWGIEVSLPSPDGSFLTTEHRFDVKDATTAPNVGDRPPDSANRTLADVEAINELTTGSTRDPDLYDLSIPDALASNRAFAIVFASPAFCTTPVCGPQVDVLSELDDAYGDRMDFIHVDLFINPHEIQGDLDLAVHTPLLAEWGLFTDEWTFVVDASGTVAGRFEGFSPYSELEETIIRTLDEG